MWATSATLMAQQCLAPFLSPLEMLELARPELLDGSSLEQLGQEHRGWFGSCWSAETLLFHRGVHLLTLFLTSFFSPCVILSANKLYPFLPF